MVIKDLKDVNSFANESDLLAADDEYLRRLNAVKETIIRNSSVSPVILLSGPSGSGKTTTARMIEKLLDDEGFETHVVSLDDYFKTVTESERGTVDFESPTRVDGELLTEHIERLIEGKEIEIPSFDFVNTRRSDKVRKLKRAENELVIFEGIHALNPSVVACGDEKTLKLYVSVRSRVKYGDGLFEPQYIRLLRRISRDKLFRGRTAEETIAYFASVSAGEQKYVFPYKRRADISIDSFVPYEAGVYKTTVGDEVKSLADKSQTADVLWKFLKNVEGISKDLVPAYSLVREFIGE